MNTPGRTHVPLRLIWGLLALLSCCVEAPAQEGAALLASDSGRVAPPWAGAPDTTRQAADASLATEGSSYFWMATRLGLGLALVVILAWGAVHLLRRSAMGRQFGAAGGVIRVAERTYLGPKKYICLVEIGGRALALGVTEETISTLAEWGAGELELPPPPSSGSFAAHLRGLLAPGREGSKSREDTTT